MNKKYNCIGKFINNYQDDSSKESLDILNYHLKLLKYQLDSLESKKPYWFQKQKLVEYNTKKAYLKNEIDSYRKIIMEEYDLKRKNNE